MDYVKNLKKELDRYQKIENLIQKKNSSTKQKDIIYYEQYIDLLFQSGESLEEFNDLYQEVKDAYQIRKEKLENLHAEIKNVKNLRV